MTRFAVALMAISLLGACSYEKTRTSVEAQPVAPAPAATVAPAGATVITQSPTTTTYTTGTTSTTVLK
ncbi:MAG TPA: hypothetical protein VEC14_12820 [Reyranellaceae bacterium]|nr:hypothetical protein [Reyranellaceae bacterium]